MEKNFCWLLVLSILLTFVACSSKTSSQKSEEEIRAEVKAEMEAEAKLKEELKAQMKAEMEAEQKKQEGEKSDQESKEEKAVGPVNTAIKNYHGEGMERLSKVTAEYKYDNPNNREDVLETLAIFGEVTNVRIGYIRLGTEGNYTLLQEFDALKDTELTIPRSKSNEDMITVAFYDKGLKEHIFAFTVEKDHYLSDKTPDKQELAASLEEKYKAATAYQDKSDLVLQFIGLSEKEFESSSIFNKFTEQIDDFDDSKYYQVENEPLGYSFILTKGYDNPNDVSIHKIHITPNEDYSAIKEDAKCSFFGVDFDMAIYQARYNLKTPKDNIFIELVESYERAGELGAINVSVVRK
ncbi:cell envelope integrity protein TolA [Petroclostridium sp. X23]|uniref:cell envelope integrity protein TolA n=1 Tax=Petroclostridium sp. X23 TaxID=3045146 RepID=UPI0024AE685C|nr:cell envelope integrity protein TolA [Petroclostridium sp. X23]WHH60965.1 cell envelope integrity protein TolA [Petroclostridium sp. X23]